MQKYKKINAKNVNDKGLQSVEL